MTSLHGGNIYAAARTTGRPLHRLLDFSASINPLGPSPRALRAIVAALPFIVHYPDPDSLSLRHALAEHYGLRIEHFAIGNGSTEFIHLLPFVLPWKTVMVIGPTFTEYGRAIRLHGGQIYSLDARRDQKYQPPIQEAIDILHKRKQRIDAVILCNPNSPTGQAIDQSFVRTLIKTMEDRGGWILVDETFIDYCEPSSVMSLVDGHAHLIVLRSFTKFFAIPGLRVGYVAAAPKTIEKIRSAQAPWSVNTLGEVAAGAALNDKTFISQSLRLMSQERPRFLDGLRAIAGMTVYPSQANFFLGEVPMQFHATTVVESLRQRDLLIRDCSLMTGLTKRTIRIAIRSASENDQLVLAMRRVLLRKRKR